MKLFIVALLLAVIYLTAAAPNMKDFASSKGNSEVDSHEKHDQHSRVRRFTCDVLAVFGPTVTRSACATHCFFLGKHGGDCENAMCVCRSENIVETWNKQFGHFFEFQ